MNMILIKEKPNTSHKNLEELCENLQIIYTDKPITMIAAEYRKQQANIEKEFLNSIYNL